MATLLLLFTHREGCAEKNKIGFCFLFDTGTQSIAFSVTGYVLLLFLTAPGSCLQHQREVPATDSSFYVSVLYTAMLRTSIAAVFLICFYFCHLDCDAPVMVVDCAAVETGCMLERYIPAKGCNKIRAHFYFLVEVLLLLLPRAADAAAHISTGAERGADYCLFLLRFCP